MDAGDLFVKSPIKDKYLKDKDKLAPLFIKAYNDMGYQFINIGDNDVLLGLDLLKRLEKQSDFPLVSANIFNTIDTINPVFQPYIILKKAKLKFGFIGVASRPPLDLDNIYVGNPMKYYKKYYTELKDKCDYIIAVAALNNNDEYKMLKSDIQANLIILANQYKYSIYIQSQLNKFTVYTGHSGKRIPKIIGLITDRTKAFGNASEIYYKYKLNQQRLDRYEKAAKGQKVEEYYKKQPTFLRAINRIKKQQKEFSEMSTEIVNPLELELLEVELECKQEPELKEEIKKYRKYIGEENKK